jgi:hypothetical protein
MMRTVARVSGSDSDWAVFLFIGAHTARLDSHHAPYGVVAPGENDRELIGLSVAGDFQLFHSMLLLSTRHRVEMPRGWGDCLPLRLPSLPKHTCIYRHSKRA